MDNSQGILNLPESIKNVLFSDQLLDDIEDALHIAQIDAKKENDYFYAIYNLINDILLLKIYYQNFPQELKIKLPDITEQQLTIITNIINKKVFEPLKVELEKVKQKEILGQQIQKLKEKTKIPNKTNIPVPDLKNISSSSQNEKSTNQIIKPKTTVTPPTPSQIHPKIEEQLKPESLINQNEKPTNKLIEEKITINPQTPSQIHPKIEEQLKPEPLIEQEEATKELDNTLSELPEISEITIQRPVNSNPNLKKVEVPDVTPEEQEKIRNRLLEAINKKESKPKIVDTLKEVIEKGVKPQPIKKDSKPAIQIPKEESSEVMSGSQETELKSSQNIKEDLFGVKIKEETLEPKDVPLPTPKEPIKYEKPNETNPFGEA